MNKTMRIGCVIMAAGEDCGHDRLLEDVNGFPMAEHIFAELPVGRFERVVAVTGTPGVSELASRHNIQPVWNRSPEMGACHTIDMGLDAVGDVDACMFVVADQPYLGRHSIERLLDRFEADGTHIMGLAFDGVRGNPNIFPRKYFDKLRKLTGDNGGSAVIREHPDAFIPVDAADGMELNDLDCAMCEMARLF